MRSEILTERERSILKQFLGSNMKLEKLDRVLKLRVKRNFESLNEDFVLIQKAMQKLES